MPVSYIIIGLTVLISFYAFNKEKVTKSLTMNPYLIDKENQYYRFLTSGFIHKDHVHLLWNMISLYFFGPIIEQVFTSIFDAAGTIYFIALYFMAVIISDIPTYLKNKNNPGFNSLGASGGISAVIFAYIIFQPIQLICIYFAICLPGFIMGLLFIIFSYYHARRSKDNINHDAHLYGALFGLVFCLIVYPAAFSGFIDQIRNWNPF